MKVLVIAPHPDDECIGCGGAICRHVERGDFVAVVFLTSGELGLKEFPAEEVRQIREAEARRAAKILGIAELHFLRCRDGFLSEEIDAAAEKLSPLLKNFAPELIYLPHENEWHPDHKASLPIVRAALFRARISPPQLRAYEVWTPLSEYDIVENIDAQMPKKLHALRAHKSQVAGWDYPRAIRGLNEYRGVMAGRCRFAEVFATRTID
jgi:LmbE family N-acetylglucosaminyl deacetylase